MLLAVDTSTTQIGVALYDGLQAQIVGETLWQGKLRHTVTLAPEIDLLLKRTKRNMDDLTALGVALGPGSFTSLRVGLALMKGLALARSLPLIGIPTLDVLAAAQPARDKQLLCILQAGRGRLAVGAYHLVERTRWQTDGNLRVMNIDELKESITIPTLVCGELTAEERGKLRKTDLVELSSPSRSTRRPAYLAELAWEKYHADSGNQAQYTREAAALSPIYLQVGAPIPSL